jgi:ParB family transcriptional regulator, chromosome partitioning protein
VTDAEALEAQLVENLIRAEIHPMEEAQGFRALLHLEDPKYSIEQIAAKVGKSPAFVASRLKLTDLIPAAVEAFYAGEIGVGHSLLLAKLPADQQEQALSACFKEAYNGASKPARILLPVRNLQFWIDSNVLLVLKDAPFNKRDAQLVPTAGSCADCAKRTGHNKLLFGDDLGRQGDRCKSCGIWANRKSFLLALRRRENRVCRSRPAICSSGTSTRRFICPVILSSTLYVGIAATSRSRLPCPRLDHSPVPSRPRI